jgi:hypothetical protein
MRWAVLTFLSILSLGRLSSAQTPMDVQPAKQLTRGNTIGSCGYTPIEKEKPFFDKLESDERVTGSAFSKPYRIQGKKGHFVSWFGIVRGISPPQPDAKGLTLLLEQKYFDGLTDCHIMLVSTTGSGDFQATLEGKAESIPALALIRVYGKVSEEKNNVPEVAVEYVRIWPWLSFTLSDLGAEDHSNPRWATYCKVCKGKRIYNPYPTPDYYLGVLGNPKDFGLNLEVAK